MGLNINQMKNYYYDDYIKDVCVILSFYYDTLKYNHGDTVQVKITYMLASKLGDAIEKTLIFNSKKEFESILKSRDEIQELYPECFI